ncbi:MAG: rod shape-determining protein MreD [Selenomonadaceae bacterium]|nr:rod shape-determining protein MreD [Selenomonadaceae bacterium]
MRQLGVWAAVIGSLFVLETSLMPYFAFRGVGPDFLLLFAVSFTILQGSRLGVFSAFCFGLIEDIVTGSFFGVHTLAKMAAAFVCGSLSNRVFKEQTIMPLMSSLGATAIQYGVIFGMVYLLGYKPSFSTTVSDILLPWLFYNFVFALPIHRLVIKLCESYWPEQRSKES